MNRRRDESGKREPLLCWAVSAKRYALFNVDRKGSPILRKASAHGLGHLRAPYDETIPTVDIPAPRVPLHEIGVELSQHDLWIKIASAALTDDPDRVDLNFHPALGKPAISRYAATTPKLLRWFRKFNANQPYDRQVKPFGFLQSLFAGGLFADGGPTETLASNEKRPRRRSTHPVRPIAPFDRDPAKAVHAAFDRDSGHPVPASALKTYRQVIAQYHLHPETKFANGDFVDRGTTRRRHVHVSGIRNIGKEADHWEEQFYLGLDEVAEIDHGLAPGGKEQHLGKLRALARQMGQRKLAERLGISRTTLAKRLKFAAE